MGYIQNQNATKPGAKYRPCEWSDIHKEGCPIIGWGLEEMRAGTRRYIPVGWKGNVVVWQTKAEAVAACKELNREAQGLPPLPKPTCNVRGVLFGGLAMCGSIGCGTDICHSKKPCEHRRTSPATK